MLRKYFRKRLHRSYVLSVINRTSQKGRVQKEFTKPVLRSNSICWKTDSTNGTFFFEEKGGLEPGVEVDE